MKSTLQLVVALLLFAYCTGCGQATPSDETSSTPTAPKELTAADILGDPAYQAISYGGYRTNSRDVQPTIAELKEDMKILHAMGIRLFRTYNVHFPHAANVLAAIRQLKEENANFEMYVMLGAWINCKDAFTANPDHNLEDEAANTKEIQRAVELANQYDDIVKIIAVGNEAMVKWAASYFVQPGVIFKWVNHLQALKQTNKLPKDIWITSSDNFASWGGGGAEYHVEDLNRLIEAVDYISVHTYPMHDTHYNPDFWGNTPSEDTLAKPEKIDMAMDRALDYAKAQYDSTVAYMSSLGIQKPVHIGETGWASASNSFYGPAGSKATDEYKEGLYHQRMREWTDKANISCFYFEAFDENWKDAGNPGGSENHFGLFTIDGQAKYAIWDLVDAGTFEGLGRAGKPVGKTYGGDENALLEEVLVPPVKDIK
ncbi:MAG: glycosyl hydrolase family 17 protein [Bacteroidota bacterium]